MLMHPQFIATLFINGLLWLAITQSHCCWLKSSILELPLLVVVAGGLPFLARIPKSRGNSWATGIVASIVAGVLLLSYTVYLHSNSFPKHLLDKTSLDRSRNVQRMFEEIEAKRMKDNAATGPNIGGETSPHQTTETASERRQR